MTINNNSKRTPISPENPLFHHHYHSSDHKNRMYQLVFFGFGLIFAFLGAMVLFKTTNSTCSFYFQHCELVKPFTYSFCFLLSLGSIALCFTIKPDHFAADELTGHYKKNLERSYHDLKKTHPRRSLLKDYYHATVKKMEDKKKKTQERLNLIKQASTLNYKSKKELSNKTLHEHQNKLKRVLNHFHASTLSHFN